MQMLPSCFCETRIFRGQTGVSFCVQPPRHEEVALNTKANPEVKGGSNATKRIIGAGESSPTVR